MGYSHSFSLCKDKFTKEEIETVRKILNKYDYIGEEYDIDKPPIVNEKEIIFNGFDDTGYETFALELNSSEVENFVKTGLKEYDLAVCEVLLVLKHFNPDFSLKSDGFCVSEEDYLKFRKNKELNLDGNWSQALENVKNEFGFTFEFICTVSSSMDRNYYHFSVCNL